MEWVIKSEKSFIAICNKTCATYKDIFPLFKNNKIWSGISGWSGGMWFETKYNDDVDKVVNGINMKNVASIWISNIEHGRRNQPLSLMSMDDNLKFSKHKTLKGRLAYDVYENYDAIDIPFVDAIPSDYEGIMGVPLSFLGKYCPEQFEIVGMCENEDLYHLKTKVYTTQECKDAYMAKFGKKGTYDLNASGVIRKDGKLEKVFQIILIRHKK